MTCGWDSSIYLWKLYQPKSIDDSGASNIDSKTGQPVWEYKLKNNTFNCVAIFRPEGEDCEPIVYAVSTDKSIREIKTIAVKTGDSSSLQARIGDRYDEGTSYSQILTSFQRRFLVAGVADNDKPAPIQLFRSKFEKVAEVQAHSRNISRLKLNFDNTKLFSVGDDGVIGVFTIIDKEPKKKDTSQLPAIQLSEEILIEKKRRDDLQAEIKRLNDDIKMHQDAHKKQTEDELQANQDKIEELEAAIRGQKANYDSQSGFVQDEKNQIELKGHQEIEHLRRLHQEELKIKKREHEEKVYDDNERYQDLLLQKEEQEKLFRQKISELHLM